jgi:hypothetical protein
MGMGLGVADGDGGVGDAEGGVWSDVHPTSTARAINPAR